ncbi:Tad domain-containing protein [Ponticoccus litoralis]|uniref:Tad domain-containing protein n=1 Tax=Ponticoccus litoralis TaxID=422297 RepID=A0AAW9SFW3_9RHOB
MNRPYARPLPFIGAEDGTITIFPTFMTVLTLMLAGASIDFMRHEASRVRLQATQDRAVPAADLDHGQQPADVVADCVAKAGLADDLTVFTMAFETGDAAADRMRLCASSDSHFFRGEGGEYRRPRPDCPPDQQPEAHPRTRAAVLLNACGARARFIKSPYLSADFRSILPNCCINPFPVGGGSVAFRRA